MNLFKNKVLLFFSLSIVALYFLTRFYNILGLPIFTDEAIYVRWAQIASNDATWRFISLTDGKQPMLVWIAMILMKLIEDPLLAGRIVSVLAGLGSMIGLFFLTSEIFKNRKIGLLASFLYVLYPFSLVYDRMALYDSLVSMFIIWALYFEILLVRYMRLDLALLLGMIIGGGMLTKTNANFAFILLPFLLLLINFKEKLWKKKVGMLLVYAFVALVVASAMYAVLRLSPFFHIIEAKNYVFIYPISEWLMHPFTFFIPNSQEFISWLFSYVTPPFLVLVAASFFIGKKYFKERLLLFVWFIVPFIATALFGKLLYPRHLLFTTMPLLVLGAYALYNMILFTRKIWLRLGILAVFLFLFLVNDFYIITDFAKARVPKSDIGQFIAGWPSGVGVNETIAFLKQKAATQKIYVGTEGTFGLMPYALEMYFIDNPNVKIVGYWPINDTIPKEVLEVSKKMPTYFVFYQDCPSCPHMGVAPVQWNATPIFQIERIEKERYYTLYQINAQ